MQVLTSSKARSFAETRWGRGGTSASRTNRLGVYYFSCSGHGGYVVDGKVLSHDERMQINRYVIPCIVVLVYNPETGRIIFLENPFTMRAQNYRYNSDVHTRDLEYPIYFFEEDCDWAVLEKFTDIRSNPKDMVNPEGHEESIQKTFDRWHGSKG